MPAYYNEFNPEAAAMLRQLITDGHIAPGDVDERSITEVKPDDLKGYTQCHFFAGIGGWSVALRLAGWPDDKPVWTGSAPCQPFSSAGKQKGKADKRHLFPIWLGLIRECCPATIFGEQVAAAVAHGWLDDVYQGLEAEGYAVGAAVLPACSVGAPHRRDRLWFVAHAEGQRSSGASRASSREAGRPTTDNSLQSGRASGYGDVANATSTDGQQPSQAWGRGVRFAGSSGSLVADRHNAGQPAGGWGGQAGHDTGRGSEDRIVADTKCIRQSGQGQMGEPNHSAQSGDGQAGKSVNASAGFWDSGEWLLCADKKYRLIEPSIPLLADGFQHRRPLLHGFGNAIVPQVAAEFIKASHP